MQNNQRYNVMVFNLQQQYTQNLQNIVMYGSTMYGRKAHSHACTTHLLKGCSRSCNSRAKWLHSQQARPLICCALGLSDSHLQLSPMASGSSELARSATVVTEGKRIHHELRI